MMSSQHSHFLTPDLIRGFWRHLRCVAEEPQDISTSFLYLEEALRLSTSSLMATNHKASLQVLLALVARLQLDRRTKYLALALFSDRSAYRKLAKTCARSVFLKYMITKS